MVTISFGQEGTRRNPTQEDMKKLDEMRKETITFMVNLTDTQKAPFWLIYDEYSKEKMDVERTLKELRRKARTQSDSDLKKNFEQRFSLREQEIALERKYFDKFLGVISIRQVLEFYQAEKKLRKK
jgi:Spy/CpxP family protein refolding chaperone